MFSLEDKYLAHTSPNKNPETLKEHSKFTKTYLEKIKAAKNLQDIIKNLASDLLPDDKLLEFFDNFIIWHDIGKKNEMFQKIKMKNKIFESSKGYKSDITHSNHSVYKIKEYYKENLEDILDDEKYRKLVYIFYYLLSNVWNHHGKLKYEKYKEDIQKNSNVNELDGTFYTFLNESVIPIAIKGDDLKTKEITFKMFIFIKLHFSLLIASDFFATSEYMNDIKTDDFGIFDEGMKDDFYGKFTKYYEERCNSKNKANEINNLRREIFTTSEDTLKRNLDKNIFYLEAPTGSGKTLNSLNLALSLLKSDKKLNKIFYVFPFNTLITQNKAIFEDIFKINIPVVNSITPVYYKNSNNENLNNNQEDIESNYDKTYSDRTFFNYPFVLTSHVGLFNILFGINKEDNYPLFSLANSVIILDEIQSYRSDLWEFMGYFFEYFSKSLNIKFIIMSATLPKLSKLADFFKEVNYCDLLPNSKEYFQNKLFRDRVKLDFYLLDKSLPENKDDKRNILFQNFIEITKNSNKNKILFEFITRKAAREFYEFIKIEIKDYEIYELSGDDNKLYRQFVINKIKENRTKIILVATQVIEAGVDIDMDLGFKDIAYFESEEQFLGRINRSFNKGEDGGMAYFFDYDNANNVYRNDDRLKFNIKAKDEINKDKNWRECLISKDFAPYYKKLFCELRQSKENIGNGIKNKRQDFFSFIKELNFEDIFKKMQLIENNQKRVFIPFKLDISKFNLNLIKKEYKGIENFLDGNYLCGKKVWEAIVSLNEVKSYSQKKISALSLNALADIFSFNVYLNENYKSELQYGYFYIEKFEDFINEDCKFNRKEFDKKYSCQELII